MTSIELTMAASLIGLLASQTIRVASAESDRSGVTLSQANVLNAYRIARSAAQSFGRPSHLIVSGDSVVVWSSGDGETVVLLRSPGPASAGVTLTPAWHTATIGPNGMLSGAGNVTHSFARGVILREVVVSRLGRIRLL